MNQPFMHYSCQQIDEDDIEAVITALRSDFLTQGSAIPAFEASLCAHTQAPHAVAVSSATAGLHITYMALGVTCGDHVWTSPMSFVATANAALYLGAHVDFVDVNKQTGNMCPHALANKLAKAQQTGTLPKLVTVVHYSGRACDMEAIYALKAQYGFALVEDAAHALGAAYANGKPIGSDARSNATVFSFHPVKPITTGEGGAVITHDAHTAHTLRMLRSHGITRESNQFENKNMPAWYYEQQLLGYNYRITDIQAALGTSQMKKLNRFIAARRALAETYPTLLSGLPLALPPADSYSGWHLYVVHIQPESSGTHRDAVFEALRKQNIGANLHYMPIHLHPYYRKRGFSPGMFPTAERYFRHMLSIPLHPGLTTADQKRVADSLRAALIT
jgi:UDP-4-amino-4,6-dideoxy-N-acetyl-beta-L-altrosamine transaminase